MTDGLFFFRAGHFSNLSISDLAFYTSEFLDHLYSIMAGFYCVSFDNIDVSLKSQWDQGQNIKHDGFGRKMDHGNLL